MLPVWSVRECGRLDGTVFMDSAESDFPDLSLFAPEDCVLYPTDELGVLTGAYLVN